MHKSGKNGLIMGVLAISLFALSACSANSKMHPYKKTNQLRTQSAQTVNYKNARYAQKSRYKVRLGTGPASNPSGSPSNNPIQIKASNPTKRRYGQSARRSSPTAPPPSPADTFQRWVDYEPQYTLFPGDQIDVVVPSAPELSRTLTVAPDGRISMPMASAVMAAGRSIPWVEQALEAELAKQLVDPSIAITNRSFAAQNIYVGGQVAQQGTYTLSGPIGSLEAIIMAGGFLSSAKTRQVAILRRAPNGGLMMRVINHKRGLKNVRSYADNMQLRRGDIIFVPRTSLSEVGVFVQQIRAAIPVDIGLSYNLGDNFSNNTTP